MLSAGMVHIFILKIKGCKNIKCHILYADVNKTTKYSACGDNSCTTSDRYVKILDFRHFERFFRFDQSDRKTYKKAISDGVNVSVVLDSVCGNTSKRK